MFHRIGIALLLLWPYISSSQNNTWTLEQCVQYAMDHNLSIQNANIQVKASEAGHLQSKLGMLPTIDASGNYNFSFGNTLNLATNTRSPDNAQTAQGNLNGSIPLFTGLQQLNNVKKTKYDVMASRFDYEAVRNNVALSVTSSFLQVVLNAEILKVAEKQKLLSDEQVKRTETQVKAGAIAEALLYEAQAQNARDEANIVTAKNNLDLAKLSLQLALQLEVKDDFAVTIPDASTNEMGQLANITASSVYDFAVGNQPDVKGATARVGSAQYAYKMALGSLSPTFSAFGSISSNYYNKDREIVGFDTTLGINVPVFRHPSVSEQLKNNLQKVVGFSINVPIYNGWQRMTNIRTSKLTWQNRQLELERSKNDLKQTIYEAYASAKAAAESFLSNEKTLGAAQKSFEAIRKRYSVGLANNFEFEQAKNNLFASESQLLQARYTYLFRMKVLDFYMGKPISLK